MTANARGFTLGILGISVLSVTSLVAEKLDIPGGEILMWGSLIVGGFITAKVSTTHKLLLSAALAIPAIVVIALLTWAWIAAGFPADNVGFEGTVILGILALPVTAALCLVGGALGTAFGRWMTPNKSLERTRER